MLSGKPVEVFRIMGPNQTVSHDQVTITDWMRLHYLEESRKPALTEVKMKVLHELVRSKSGTSPSDANRSICVYPEQLVDGI